MPRWKGTGIRTLVHRVGGEVLLRLCPRGVSKVENSLTDNGSYHCYLSMGCAVGGSPLVAKLVFGVGCLMVG